jgi:hypothetical protein
MNTGTITKRGMESALYACPAAAATSGVARHRASLGAVTPFQGTGLPFAGNARFAMADAPVAARTIQQLVPSHPGETARRPPA